MASYKKYVEQDDFLNLPKKEEVKPSTPEDRVTVPKNFTPAEKPKSQYKPQRYNKKTGKVEDIGPGMRNSNVTRKEINQQSATFNTSLTQPTREQQIINTELQRQRDEALIQSLQPATIPNATEEQLSSIGQVGELTPDAISQSIEENIQKKNSVGAEIADVLLGNPALGTNIRDVINPTKKFLNRQAPGLGDTVFKVLDRNENVREYLKGYSNENNFNALKENIVSADAQISVAKAIAQYPDRSIEAIELYNEAITQKTKALSEMKRISTEDQQAYVSDVKDEMFKLQIYFDKTKVIDDLELRDTIQYAKVKR